MVRHTLLRQRSVRQPFPFNPIMIAAGRSTELASETPVNILPLGIDRFFTFTNNGTGEQP